MIRTIIAIRLRGETGIGQLMAAEPSTDIAIIGGGIVGCALVYDLARRGVRATLFDRRKLAREASRASAGIISAPSPNAGDTLPIAQQSFKRYPELIAEIEDRAGFSTGWHKTGMTLPGTTEDLDTLRDLVAAHNAHGTRAALLDQTALRSSEPAVADRFVGGLHLPDVASVRLDYVSRALAIAATGMGAVIREQEAVIDIEVSGGQARAVRTVNGSTTAGIIIVAAGAWSRMFSDILDIEIPTTPVRGQMMAVSDVSPAINGVLAYDGVYILPRADGTVAAGATEEPDAGFDDSVTPEGLSWLTGRAAAIVPPFAQGKLQATWAGLRPGTTHGRPIIGPVPHIPNVWIVTGHFRSGALLAPGTSEMVVESILSENLDASLIPFAP